LRQTAETEHATVSNATPLNGQIALVTGAGRGIGAAIAQKLAALGATAVLCGRTLNTLEQTAATIRSAGGQVRVEQCDVSDLASVQALAASIEQTFRRLDILVNNAGVGSFSSPLHEVTPQTWEKILNTNLRGVIY